jgi:hypothetical protein
MILHPLVKTSPHTINNANTFLTNIKDLKLEPDDITRNMGHFAPAFVVSG